MAPHHPLRAASKTVWVALCLVALLGWGTPAPGLDAQSGGPGFDLQSLGGAERTAALALGDLNGDGWLDIVVGNRVDPTGQESSRNQAYLNPGKEAAPWIPQPVGGGGDTHSIALGDLNGDGRLDLAVGNEGQSFLYLSAGAEGWAETPFGNPQGATRGVALGDLNGDRLLDLVAGRWGASNQVYLNRGAGILAPARTLDSSSPAYTSSVAVGDLDRDGDLDVAAANWNGENVVYFNNGAGYFQKGSTFGGANLATSIAAADLSGDGALDLMVGALGQNRVYLNNGQGAFATGEPLGEEDRTQSVAVGDLNGDGLLDVVAGNRDQQNVVYLNDGQIGASPGLGALHADSLLGGQEWTESVAVGDLNDDGRLDVVAGNSREPSSIYLNLGASGGGTGESGAQLPTGLSFGPAAQTRGVAVGDMDGDGWLDIVAGNRGRNSVCLNDGPGSPHFNDCTPFGDDLTEGIALGDMDGDGDLDVVAGNQGYNVLYIGNGEGALVRRVPFGEAGVTHSVALGDLDQDGDLDVVAGGDGENQVYLNDGQGDLTGVALDPPEETKVTWSVAVGDLNGDGCLDVVAGNEGLNQVYWNAGQGAFERGALFEASTTRAVALSDLDGDGDLDVVAGNYDAPSQVYLNDGTGQFGTAHPFAEIEHVDSLAVGDWDGDGDLDVTVGNWGAQNQVYLNDGQGRLSAELVFGGADDADSVALGDLDGDGSLDVVTGIHGHQNRAHLNPARRAAGHVDHPATPRLFRPGPTADAGFYSSPVVLAGPTLDVRYTLSDPEGDEVRFVRLLYSPDGGGTWHPATPAGGTVTTHLDTRAPGDPPGAGEHVYTWQVDADAGLVRSDHVVLRLEAYPGYGGPGPYQWPYLAAHSFPFRLSAPWYAKVVDRAGHPLAGATLYADGVPYGAQTDEAGLLGLNALAMGTRLAALAPVAERPTTREQHEGWAYRTYLTSEPFTVSGAGEQRLVMRRDRPLILLNLVVSIEWDADQAYVDQIERAMRATSAYIHDLTDGQMAFQKVVVYDNAQHWDDADVQISAKNVVRPHAYIGGLVSGDHSHVIRVGRFWNGYSGSEGAWDEPDGYRTLGHEFGHYALHLYDEYFDYLEDAQGNLVGEVEATCTGQENRNPAHETTNASAMDYQYTSSELSARDVAGIWSSECERTAQWHLLRESPWETFARLYSHAGTPPLWQVTTPRERGTVEAGPTALRDDLPDWPEMRQNAGASIPVIALRVREGGKPYAGALVTLYTNQSGHPVAIDQGFTDPNGQIDVYGAQPGDTLRASSFDGALGGAVSVGAATSYTLDLSPPAGLRALAVPERNPQLTLHPGSDGRSLYLNLSGLGPGGHLAAIVTHSDGSSQPTALAYSSALGGYEGVIAAETRTLGTGTAQVIGTAGNGQGVSLSSSYALQALPRAGASDLHSPDGNVHLHAITGTLPVDAYLVLAASNAVPARLPDDTQIVGNAYDLRFSGAMALKHSAWLRIHYDRALLAQGGLRVGLYRWDAHAERWVEIASKQDIDATRPGNQRIVAAPVRWGGTYVLLASPFVWTDAIYAPIVLK